jgi:cytoskeletal protein CcmA (bactofilin family)
MIKAGALLYAMFLIIVIAIISSSFIMVNYYNSAYVVQVLKKEQIYRDANSGINYGLSFHQEIPINSKLEVDLFNDEQHNVLISKKHWGAFYILSSEAKWRNKLVSKSALVGANINEGEEIALYLADQNKPLSLTGRTVITGNCYLPKSGVKRAYIEGKSFVGNKLINGIKYNSNITLPPINEELIAENLKNFSSTESISDSLLDYELFLEQDSIINSFSNKTLVLYSPLNIELSNKVIEGNIIIKSDKQITVQSSAIISNAILYAKGIILKKNVEGTMQVFAKDSIIVEENCQLHYPSVLALIGQGNSIISRKISIAAKTVIKGSVFLYNENFDRKHQSLISIGEKAEITGQVYSSELLELKGKVQGGVFCKKLLLKTSSSVYENHLMDAVINREELSEYFVGVPLTETIKHQRIIKWLN